MEYDREHRSIRTAERLVWWVAEERGGGGRTASRPWFLTQRTVHIIWRKGTGRSVMHCDTRRVQKVNTSLARTRIDATCTASTGQESTYTTARCKYDRAGAASVWRPCWRAPALPSSGCHRFAVAVRVRPSMHVHMTLCRQVTASVLVGSPAVCQVRSRLRSRG